MTRPPSTLRRAEAFCERFGLGLPIIMAPMAGACPAPLAAAVANAGGMGACGALMMSPEAILRWASSFREMSKGGFQMNLWIPQAAPVRDEAQEAAIRLFLSSWGPAPEAQAGDARTPDFSAQCEAMLQAGPAVVSSIMGLYPEAYVRRLKASGIPWWATVTTLTEAKMAEAAGADVIVVQGMEAGGHRGTFDAARAQAAMVGLFALVPAVADAVSVPVVAAGGIADGRGVAAALLLGASAVQVGTAFLRVPEARTHPAWADALALAGPEDTAVSTVFSGRPGRSLATAFVRAATAPNAPAPAPYPVQRALTAPMRAAAAEAGDVERMQAWAGQSAALAKVRPAGDLTREWWAQAEALLNAAGHDHHKSP